LAIDAGRFAAVGISGKDRQIHVDTETTGADFDRTSRQRLRPFFAVDCCPTAQTCGGPATMGITPYVAAQFKRLGANTENFFGKGGLCL
jgi:hypothetical protein